MDAITLYRQAPESTIGYSGFTEADAVVLFDCLEETKHVIGDRVEFGSYRGRSGWLTAQWMGGSGKRLWMYDTFDTFPDEPFDIDRKWRGKHHVNYEEVRDLFAPFEFVTLVRGDFTETVEGHGPEQVSFALIDCDSYRGTTFAAYWTWERLSRGGVIMFQDYGKSNCRGATLAVDGFMEAMGIEGQQMDNGCMIVRKPLVRFLVTAWGSYLWLLRPFIESWKRLWNPLPPVSLAGEKPDWWDGDFIDTFPRPGWHPSHYSRCLRATFESIEEPVVFLCPVDTFALAEVDNDRAMAMARYIVARGNVMRLQLHLHKHCGVIRRYHNIVDAWEGYDLAQCSDLGECSILAGMAMDAALWNRELFAEVVTPGKMFWQVEVDDTYKMWRERPELMSVVAWPPLFWATDIIQNKTPKVLRHMEELLPEDREAVERARP